MRIYCSWCPTYGREPTFLGEKAPFDNNEVTHSMCKTCYDSFGFSREGATHATTKERQDPQDTTEPRAAQSGAVEGRDGR